MGLLVLAHQHVDRQCRDAHLLPEVVHMMYRLVQSTGFWWFAVAFNWLLAVERFHSALYDSWWYVVATVLHLMSLALSIKGLRRAQAHKRLRKELAYLENVAWLKELREPPYN